MAIRKIKSPGKRIIFPLLGISLVSFIFFLVGNCKKDESSPDDEAIYSKLQPTIESFISKSGVNAELLGMSYISDIKPDSLEVAVYEIIGHAAFIGDSAGIVKIYRLDSVMTPNPDTLAAVKAFYKRYLDTVIEEPDMVMVAVNWKFNTDDTVVTYAVVRQNGDIIYEPILSVCYLEQETRATKQTSDTAYVNHQVYRWKNSYGCVAVDIRFDLKAVTSDGCQALFTYNLVLINTMWPLDVKTGINYLSPYCKSKPMCMCRTEPGVHDRMECATGTTTYEFTGRSGTSEHAYILQWHPEYMKKYEGSISGSLCADGS